MTEEGALLKKWPMKYMAEITSGPIEHAVWTPSTGKVDIKLLNGAVATMILPLTIEEKQ